jgi:hypothetical protein
LGEEDVVEKLWGRHRQWSLLADQLKRRITFFRTVTLVLSASGALLQTLSASLSLSTASKVVGAVGAAALVVVPFIARSFLVPDQVRSWLRARSVSEGLKSLIYRFRARAAPYDGAGRVEKLDEDGKKIEIWAEALAVELASVQPDAKPAPGPLDGPSYVQQRITQQIDHYYRPNARKNARLAALFRRLELASAGLAALLGSLATALQLGNAKAGVGAWVGVLTTIGGALAAHAAASRYEQQARTFYATARQLEDLRTDWGKHQKSADAARWSELVTACEEAISAENRGWMAKLDPEEKDHAASVPGR